MNYRKPLDNCEVIGHPAQAAKWKTDINFNDDRVNDLPVVHIPINLFLDDTATHKSRQWMALHCIQMQIAGRIIHKKNLKNYKNSFRLQLNVTNF